MQRDAEFDASACVNHSRHLFTAPFRGEVIGVSLPAVPTAKLRSPGRTVLDAAAALARAETWLVALEDWLGEGLDFSLSPEEDPLTERWVFTQHVRVQHITQDISMFVPCKGLTELGAAPPAALAAWSWTPLPCEFVLDSVHLPDSELACLEVGALLMLPASFSGDWRARLEPQVNGVGARAARVAEANAKLHAELTSGPAPDAEAGVVRICGAKPAMLMPGALFGWTTSPAGAVSRFPVEGAVSLVRGSMNSGSVLATGQLMPMAAGYAMRIEQMRAVSRTVEKEEVTDPA